VKRGQDTSGWRLKVSDQGRAAGQFDIDQSKGFGMRVLKAFVRRFNATMTLSRPGHTAFEVTSVEG
jgi:two-component sensor histidine kinase